uniref:Uncharacterized protein n=1 Tax=Arundo donax TaxID=35708 RepID=A0A0A9G9V8_ARUDO
MSEPSKSRNFTSTSSDCPSPSRSLSSPSTFASSAISRPPAKN